MTSTTVQQLHPRTGSILEPIYTTKSGRVIYPMLGGAEDEDEDEKDDDESDEDEGDDDKEEDDKDEDSDDDSSDADDEEDLSKWTPAQFKKHAKKLRSEAAGLRKRLKEAEPGSKAWAEYQKSLKSKEEQLAGEVSEKDKNLAETRRENWLLKIQIKTGLSDKQLGRLKGDDFDELLADAKEFIADNPGAVGTPKPRKTPGAKDLRGGSDPSDDKDNEEDPAKLASRVRRGY